MDAMEDPTPSPAKKDELVTIERAVNEYLANAKTRELGEATPYKLNIIFRSSSWHGPRWKDTSSFEGDLSEIENGKIVGETLETLTFSFTRNAHPINATGHLSGDTISFDITGHKWGMSKTVHRTANRIALNRLRVCGRSCLKLSRRCRHGFNHERKRISRSYQQKIALSAALVPSVYQAHKV
jgi:hypothetical protein